MLVGAIICSGLDGFYPFDQALTAQRSGGVNGFPACDELQDHHTERENVWLGAQLSTWDVLRCQVSARLIRSQRLRGYPNINLIYSWKVNADPCTRMSPRGGSSRAAWRYPLPTWRDQNPTPGSPQRPQNQVPWGIKNWKYAHFRGGEKKKRATLPELQSYYPVKYWRTLCPGGWSGDGLKEFIKQDEFQELWIFFFFPKKERSWTHNPHASKPPHGPPLKQPWALLPSP